MLSAILRVLGTRGVRLGNGVLSAKIKGKRNHLNFMSMLLSDLSVDAGNHVCSCDKSVIKRSQLRNVASI